MGQDVIGTIPVIWHAQDSSRGYYNSTAMVNEILDQSACDHIWGMGRMPEGLDGAVFIVHGCRELGGIDKLNLDLQKFPKWALIICLGDEENTFPVERIEHPNKIIWVQEPRPGRHDFADRLIINGYSDRLRQYLASGVPKENDWFFAGQVTHERRRDCVTALQGLDWGGIIIETKGYTQGVSRTEYVFQMQRARIVPCPSGPFCQDAARVWEALECGAIPILDDISPARPEGGFWKYLLGYHPLPVIREWALLPLYLKEIKANYDSVHALCMNWWAAYKAEYSTWLRIDVRTLKERANARSSDHRGDDNLADSEPSEH